MRHRHNLMSRAAPRAISRQFGVRADNRDPIALIGAINTEVAAIRGGIETRLGALETAIEDVQASVAADRLGPDAGSPPTAGGRRRRHSPLSADVQGELRGMMQGNPQARAMTTQSDPDGGYTVIPQLDRTIGEILRDISPLRDLATVVLQEGGTGDWERIIQTQGAASGWAGEEDDRDDTDGPTYGKVTVPPHELFAVPSLTNHLLDDSGFDLEAFLETDVGGEFAIQEGQAFVDGDGVKKPMGFLSNATSADADADRAFGTLQFIKTGVNGAFAASNPGDKLKDLLAILKPAYRKGDGVAWLMNSTTANVISKMKDGQDNYLWTESIIQGQPDRLLGYPVALDEGMPDIANGAFAVAFGNWRRGYAIVDKPGIKLIVDKVTRKGWTKLYFSKRVGGHTLDTRAIKLLQFAA
jgi:HK97 family phage major capsid protein